MQGYGQFCPMVLAAEIVGERWTLLVKRLRALERADIVSRMSGGGQGIVYWLTDAGENLLPVVENLAVCGKAWLPARLSDENADPDLLMWDLHRSMDCSTMPEAQIVIRFDFLDQPRAKRWRWVLGSVRGAQLCITDPGYDVDLFVTTDCVTMIRIWHGDAELRHAIDEGAVALDGPHRLRSAFPRWIRRSPLAEVPRKVS